MNKTPFHKRDFAPGDKVICVDASAVSELVSSGVVYTIQTCDRASRTLCYLTLEEVKGASFWDHRFELYYERDNMKNDTSTKLEQGVNRPGEGKKFDQGKAPISIIPAEAILREAEVFAFGAKKYGKHNFKLGFDYSRPIDAALRHILAFANGEDLDPETGLSHLAHARCCLAMIIYFQETGTGTDDRFKPKGA